MRPEKTSKLGSESPTVLFQRAGLIFEHDFENVEKSLASVLALPRRLPRGRIASPHPQSNPSNAGQKDPAHVVGRVIGLDADAQDPTLAIVLRQRVILRIFAAASTRFMGAFASYPLPPRGALHEFDNLVFAENQESNSCDVDQAPANVITKNVLSLFYSRMVVKQESDKEPSKRTSRCLSSSPPSIEL
jgi:hypothetical protein